MIERTKIILLATLRGHLRRCRVFSVAHRALLLRHHPLDRDQYHPGGEPEPGERLHRASFRWGMRDSWRWGLMRRPAFTTYAAARSSAAGTARAVRFASAFSLGSRCCSAGWRRRLPGLLVGIPSLRLKGDYLAIVTLGFGEIIRVVIENMDALGGARGFSVARRLHEFLLGVRDGGDHHLRGAEPGEFDLRARFPRRARRRDRRRGDGHQHDQIQGARLCARRRSSRASPAGFTRTSSNSSIPRDSIS